MHLGNHMITIFAQNGSLTVRIALCWKQLNSQCKPKSIGLLLVNGIKKYYLQQRLFRLCAYLLACEKASRQAHILHIIQSTCCR